MRNSRLLAYVTGSVNQELLLRNEYLAVENRILRSNLAARVRLTNSERATLAVIGKRLGRKPLREVACVTKPNTILGWYRKLVAQKFDGSKNRCPWGLTMATEIILDQWNPSKKQWRMESHCYEPRDCPRYRAGKPR